jgi:hypothetical protein
MGQHSKKGTKKTWLYTVLRSQKVMRSLLKSFWMQVNYAVQIQGLLWNLPCNFIHTCLGWEFL